MAAAQHQTRPGHTCTVDVRTRYSAAGCHRHYTSKSRGTVHTVTLGHCNLMYGMITSTRGPTPRAGVLGGTLRAEPPLRGRPSGGRPAFHGFSRALFVRCDARHAAHARSSPLLVTNADGKRKEEWPWMAVASCACSRSPRGGARYNQTCTVRARDREGNIAWPWRRSHVRGSRV